LFGFCSLRIQRAAELKALKSNPTASKSLDVDATIAAVAPAARKKRVLDVLQEVLGDAEEGSSTDEEADQDDDFLLDWRAKAV
jgi:hypothetical protein